MEFKLLLVMALLSITLTACSSKVPVQSHMSTTKDSTEAVVPAPEETIPLLPDHSSPACAAHARTQPGPGAGTSGLPERGQLRIQRVDPPAAENAQAAALRRLAGIPLDRYIIGVTSFRVFVLFHGWAAQLTTPLSK